MSSQTPEKVGSKAQQPSSIPTYDQIRKAQYLITKKSAQRVNQLKHLVAQQQEQNR